MTAGIWSRAEALGRRAGPDRNRYVDFLRAVSILLVVLGHWLMAAPEIAPDGTLRAGEVLVVAPWSRWLTWIFQVMPVFFMVGGYANTLSWRSARRRRLGYGSWLHARLRRLALPLVPLVVFWVVLGFAALRLGIDPAILKVGSQAALTAVWFLAVYIGVTALAPAAIEAWERWRWLSLAVPAAAAGVADWLFFGPGWEGVGWANYLLVWAAVHQLGIAWAHGSLGGPRRSLPWAAAGLAGMVVLVGLLDYPVSMVGVTGAAVNNTAPPKLPLLALGVFQTGVLLSLEAPARRRLARPRPWTFTVLVNGSIMTLYLWHLTAMVSVVGLALAAGGVGLGYQALTAGWWLTRPVWLAVMAAATVPFVAVFSRFERPRGETLPPSTLLSITGTVLVCAGLGLVAYFGIGDAGGLNWEGPAVFAAGVVAGRVIGSSRRQEHPVAPA